MHLVATCRSQVSPSTVGMEKKIFRNPAGWIVYGARLGLEIPQGRFARLRKLLAAGAHLYRERHAVSIVPRQRSQGRMPSGLSDSCIFTG
jgi:hypothetical protein